MSNAAAANTNTLQIMEELDAPQSIREVERAIDFLASDKTPNKNGISPEVVKAGKDTSAERKELYAKTCVNQHNHPLQEQR